MGSEYISNEGNFRRQSYRRLIRYAKPYKYKLAVGILAGFAVGGSLLMSNLMIPRMVMVVENPTATADETAKSANEILNELNLHPEWSEEERLHAVQSVLNPSLDADDPQMAALVKQVEKTISEYSLPAKVDGSNLIITWPTEVSVPIYSSGERVSWQIFAMFAFCFMIMWMIRNLAIYLNRFFTRWVGARVVADMRNEIFSSLLGQSLGFYGQMDVGHLISRCSNDTAAIESSVSDVIADLTRCPIEILACATAIIITSIQNDNYILPIILFIGMPMVVLPVMMLSKHIKKAYKASFAKIAEVTSRMHEVFTGIRVVKAYNTEEQEDTKFRAINRRYFKYIVKALRQQLLMQPLMEIVAVGATLIFGVYSYTQNVSLTEIAALLAPAILAYEPIKNLSKVLPTISRSCLLYTSPSPRD